jgi:hypothetical protein
MDRRILRAGLFAAAPLLLVPSPVPAGGIVPRVPFAPARALFPTRLQAPPAPRVGTKVGLGHILSTADGGQVFGFDINQKGTDGVLASAQTTSPSGDMLVSVETFDQDTGKITKSFAKKMGKRDSYAVDGIFTGDVALVTHFISTPGKLGAVRKYETMSPVTAGKFTGTWTPPIKNNFDVLQSVPDQTNAASVLFIDEFAPKAEHPDLVVTDIAKNTFSNVFPLDPNLFGGANGPQLGEFTKANKAVIALSPDGGRVGGAAPLNVLIDLKTGKQTQFTGLNQGPFGSGFVNGLAVDPNTGIAATTTELNAQVEFYDLTKQAGIGVQLPCTGPASQINSGAGIAIDPVHKLFLVTDPTFCNGSQGSAIVVYDEKGNLVETIAGFGFAIAEPAPVLNTSKRMGWAFGPSFANLQQFFY